MPFSDSTIMLLLAKTISKLSVFCGRKLAAGNTRINELCTRNICFSSLKSWGCGMRVFSHLRNYTHKRFLYSWMGSRCLEWRQDKQTSAESLLLSGLYDCWTCSQRTKSGDFPSLWAPQRCSDRLGEDPGCPCLEISMCKVPCLFSCLPGGASLWTLLAQHSCPQGCPG